MTQHCSGSSKALITITKPEKEEVISNNTPVDVTVGEIAALGNFQDYTHTMTAPISVSFAKEIDRVELNDPVNRWCYGRKDSISSGNPPYDLMTSCPTVGGAVLSGAEGLIIEGKTLRSNFDYDPSGRDAYFNNYGTCSYRVYFKGISYPLTIKDKTGQIFSKTYQTKPEYTVACDDQCPAGQERIPTIEYPGYRCREKCPPETCCECDCGDVICCYGSNGQVIKTIAK